MPKKLPRKAAIIRNEIKKHLTSIAKLQKELRSHPRYSQANWPYTQATGVDSLWYKIGWHDGYNVQRTARD